jgi:uncharacterized membrane protein
MDITLYEFLLFLHITAAAVWVGGSTMLQAIYMRVRRAEPRRMIEFMSDVSTVGTRLFVPTSLLLVILGFALAAEGNWDLGEFWIAAAMAVFLASFITGAAFLGPESGRISALAAERGPEDTEVRSRISRVLLVSRIELLLLVLVILDMVIKPGL